MKNKKLFILSLLSVIVFFFALNYVTIAQNSTSYCNNKDDEKCNYKKDYSIIAEDVKNVVINDSTQTCAFVQDINNCPLLPMGWRPASNNKTLQTACPSDYQWLNKKLACKKIEDQRGSQGLVKKIKDQDTDILVFIAILVYIIILFMMILFSFVIQKKKSSLV